MINICNIEFAYNTHLVLKDVSCMIEAGDFVALVGPNGSGKSTLIKCINRILKIRKGNISIEWEDVTGYSSVALAEKIAYVPQNESKTSSSIVFNTVLLGRKPYIGWKPSEKDFEITAGVIRLLGLDNISMRSINELSGGQQQIVMIARALAQEPQILLLDEPTANLDIKHQLETMELLKTLSGKGITIIIAIHDINMALRYANRIMMLKEGRIYAYGGKEVINSENIEILYDIKARIIDDGVIPYILPIINH